jgi:aarF domain-containing kinase
LSVGVFWWSKIRQAFGAERGLEDILEDQMKTMAKDFGVELNHGVFEG